MEEKKVGTYKIVDKIAETNGAFLYRALNCKSKDKTDELFYAIKEYGNDLIQNGALENEKRITHEIENNAPKSIVVPILEVIQEGKKEYAVMQFRKNGLFLNELIHQLEVKNGGTGKIPVKLQIAIIREILYALSVLHSFGENEQKMGYLHLDLHPGNLFFESVDIEKGQVGKVKFVDFLSSVRMREGKTEIDADNMVHVSSIYSAPEQIRRETYKYGPATDLFSVAVIFFGMLTGSIRKNEEETWEEILSEYLDEKLMNPIMKYSLISFMECGTGLNPRYRYRNAEEMLETLERLEACNEAVENMDYYRLFSCAYEMLMPEEKVIFINHDVNIKKLREAVRYLADDLLKDKIDVYRCKYLFRLLWKMMECMEESVSDDILYSLINSGIACCNHTADNKMAWILYDRLENGKEHIPAMDYLGYLNRIAVMYADSYEFEKAYEIVTHNIQCLEIIKDAYRNVAEKNGMVSKDSIRIMDLARAYSAKGTYMVLTDREEPLDEFKRALNEFGDNAGNRMITISHILQYAIESGNKHLYEEYGKEYFGKCDDIGNALDMIMAKDRFNAYKLLVFLKGIYTFYIEEIDLGFQNKISQLATSQILKNVKEHPIELIYKYIALILYEKEKEVSMEVEDALLTSLQCIDGAKINLRQELNILMGITYQTMWIYNELTGQEEENRELLLIMQEHCKKSGWTKMYKELVRKKSIKDLLKYEYR